MLLTFEVESVVYVSIQLVSPASGEPPVVPSGF